MTDKQIIIDGVDVSGCDCYYDGKCLCEYNEIDRKIIRYYSCNKFPNCYYKQLKRKEQECEQLKKIINEAKNSKLDLNSFFAIEAIVGEYQLELDQLKAENERLEAHSATLDAVIETGRVQYKALKQTLTEIKEIAEKIDDSDGCAYGDYDCDNCSSLEQETVCTYKVKKLILQKISEVEDD